MMLEVLLKTQFRALQENFVGGGPVLFLFYHFANISGGVFGARGVSCSPAIVCWRWC